MTKQFIISQFINGQLQNRTALVKLFRGLKDGRYEISVKSVTKRSLAANAYYWFILTDFIQPALYDLGWRGIKTKDDAHFFCGDMFLKVKIVNEDTGEVKERVRSTTELTKEEFGIYLEEIIQWAAEDLYIAIPSPSQQFEMYSSTHN